MKILVSCAVDKRVFASIAAAEREMDFPVGSLQQVRKAGRSSYKGHLIEYGLPAPAADDSAPAPAPARAIVLPSRCLGPLLPGLCTHRLGAYLGGGW